MKPCSQECGFFCEKIVSQVFSYALSIFALSNDEELHHSVGEKNRK